MRNICHIFCSTSWFTKNTILTIFAILYMKIIARCCAVLFFKIPVILIRLLFINTAIILHCYKYLWGLIHRRLIGHNSPLRTEAVIHRNSFCDSRCRHAAVSDPFSHNLPHLHQKVSVCAHIQDVGKKICLFPFLGPCLCLGEKTV